MSDKKQKHSGPKPWAQRVAARRRAKSGRRKFWSAARWRKHDLRRAALRQRERLPRRMSNRQPRKRELAISAARRARMRVYHARRCFALALAKLNRDAEPRD